MSDTFYAIDVGEVSTRDVSKLVVATSSTSAKKIELRVTDGAMTRRQVYMFLEFMADVFASGSNMSDNFPIPAGNVTG